MKANEKNAKTDFLSNRILLYFTKRKPSHFCSEWERRQRRGAIGYNKVRKEIPRSQRILHNKATKVAKNKSLSVSETIAKIRSKDCLHRRILPSHAAGLTNKNPTEIFSAS